VRISRARGERSFSRSTMISGMRRRAREAARGEGNAGVEQDAAHLAEGGRAMIDQALPGPVHRLEVLLLHRLQRYEPLVRLLHGRADRFGVVTVVLLSAHNGLTYCGLTILTVWPSARTGVDSRTRRCGPRCQSGRA
jgi:hypothetical protein